MKRLLLLGVMMLANTNTLLVGEDFDLHLRFQQPTHEGSPRFHRLTRQESWAPEKTAIIVCDVWDLHHCKNAVDRIAEFGPRLNQVLETARSQGATIIHSPSDCMPFYADHPARKRALQTPAAANLPADIRSWCSRIPSEEAAVYPVDQSDGGEDDVPGIHAKWAAELKSLGRNPNLPWKKQSDLISIDDEQDFISDRGDEVWNILENRQIENVILTGVHVNMCVLGRPFGLRQLKQNGKHVVLMRDMTDAMYNPKMWPYVSHFTGNDLIISHIERFVCPTMTSDQFLGGKPFRFKQDTRPHLVIVMAEDEYKTNQTLPRFAVEQLGKHFKVSLVFGNEKNRNDIPGIEILNDADLALISIRRRVLPPEQMAVIRNFAKAGNPIVGIRTASHAFSLRNETPPDGLEDWPEFDAEIFGGNYSNHHGNKLRSVVKAIEKNSRHPILSGFPDGPVEQGGSLYVTSPLASGATVLLSGTVEGKKAEPVAWTFKRAEGARSFYTSMGHVDDFSNVAFLRLLTNGIHWAADIPIADPETFVAAKKLQDYWMLTAVPSSFDKEDFASFSDNQNIAWYRCAVRIPKSWIADDDTLSITFSDKVKCWINGHELTSHDENGKQVFVIDSQWVEADDANLLVFRVDGFPQSGIATAPELSSGERNLDLSGNWQLRLGDRDYSNMPLPAKFGASPDILFEIK